MFKFSRSMRAASLAALTALSLPAAQAWDKWDAFKAANVNEGFRVVDYSDSRRITTSEGQSYALFFALVAGDKASFEKLLKWTEDNLAAGDITKHKPAWLWGKGASGWGILDDNNAADSDMWIAYDLLEAGRLWNRPDYTAKAKAMMTLLKKDVRDVEGLGKVILPGYKGFEQKNFVTLNPSYYPVFILRRFAQEDPEWNAVIEGTVRALVRSSPRGFAPDWVRFDLQGKMMAEKGDDYTLGSYNAIRTYMWAAMMSQDDPVRGILTERYAPFAKLTAQNGMPPETINIHTGKGIGTGSTGFAACVLELLGPGAAQNYLRTVVENDPIVAENYYRNTLLIYAIGFDRGLYSFDRNGYLMISDKATLTKIAPKAAPEPADKPAEEQAPAEEPVDETVEADKSEAADQAKEAAKAEPKAQAKTEPKAEVKMQALPEAKSEAKPEAKTDTQPAPAPAAAPAAQPRKAEGQPEVSVEVKGGEPAKDKAAAKPADEPAVKAPVEGAADGAACAAPASGAAPAAATEGSRP